MKIFAPVGGVLLLAVGYFVFLGGGGEADDAAAPTTTVVVDGPVIEAEQMTINLADEDPRYARLKFAVVLPEGGDAAAVGERFPMLKDAVLDVVVRYTAEDMRSADILETLRGEFSAKARNVWPDGEVLRVLITELLVQ
jgi:flagellar basal body-associated protein FliL